MCRIVDVINTVLSSLVLWVELLADVCLVWEEECQCISINVRKNRRVCDCMSLYVEVYVCLCVREDRWGWVLG